MQIAAIGISLGFAIVGGILTGLLTKLVTKPLATNQLFTDSAFYHLPHDFVDFGEQSHDHCTPQPAKEVDTVPEVEPRVAPTEMELIEKPASHVPTTPATVCLS